MDLLERLLRFNPADRLTAEEALTHPYFLDLHCANDEPVVINPFSIEHEVNLYLNQGYYYFFLATTKQTMFEHEDEHAVKNHLNE